MSFVFTVERFEYKAWGLIYKAQGLYIRPVYLCAVVCARGSW